MITMTLLFGSPPPKTEAEPTEWQAIADTLGDGDGKMLLLI